MQNTYIKNGYLLSSIISYSIEIFKCLYSEFSFPLNDVLLEGTDKKASKEYKNKNQKTFYCL
jgi:hypothetical protein